MRVNPEHWILLLKFAERNPQIITNKFVGIAGRVTALKLWKELTNLLNSLGYGSKSIEEWKKTLADWKSKTKTKAAKINYSNKTGDGGSSTLVLSANEQRLLEIMRTAAVDDGDSGVRKCGISNNEGIILQNNVKPADLAEPIANVNTSGNIKIEIDTSLYAVEENSVNIIEIVKNEVIDEENVNDNFVDKSLSDLDVCDTTPAQISVSATNRVCADQENSVYKSAPKRYKTMKPNAPNKNRKKDDDIATKIEKMNEKTLQVLTNIDNNLNRLVNVMEKIAESVHEKFK